jgi:hypothetical protein
MCGLKTGKRRRRKKARRKDENISQGPVKDGKRERNKEWKRKSCVDTQKKKKKMYLSWISKREERNKKETRKYITEYRSLGEKTRTDSKRNEKKTQ